MNLHRFGVCTWTFGDLPLAEIARRLANLGFDGVELKGDLTLYTAAQARTILADYGLSVFSLTPDNVDLSHPDATVRETAVDYYRRLTDFAAALGEPLISCHGLVGRVSPLGDLRVENGHLVSAVREITAAAAARGLRVVFEVLNRYESHQVQTCRAAKGLLETVEADNLGILLDAYHMNIEEADPAQAIRDAGDRLWLYHAADSNRQAAGRGHTDFAAQVAALRAVDYGGPVIFECTAPGPDPFVPIKDERSLEWLQRYLGESLARFRELVT